MKNSHHSLLALAALVHASLPDIAERVSPVTAQKLRDAVQEVELASDYGATAPAADLGQPFDIPSLGLPVELAELFTIAKNELARRATDDEAHAVLAARNCAALERIADAIETLVIRGS